MKYNLANRMNFIVASEVREILKVTERPEILSFAGGLPAPELFPYEELSKLSAVILHEEGVRTLQYATTEGYTPLREWIISRLNNYWGMHIEGLDNIVITSGSQSGLDLVSKLFIDQDDVVWSEAPTYMAALAAFRICGAKFEEMECDDDGVIIEEIANKLKTKRPKFVYVITNFQNPSGRTWSMERRRKFMDLMTEYEIPVVEDNAYYELNFDNTEHCSLSRFDTKGLVVCLGSFSKVLCPGLRVAWITASKELIRKLVILKQATDLQTPVLNQMLIHRYLMNNDFNERLRLIRSIYKERRDAMVSELEVSAPEGVSFTRPRGGMFVWIELPADINAKKLLQRCLTHHVAMVPGDSFYPVTHKPNMARFNFSNLPPETIRHGVRVLCDSIREEMAAVRNA
ncbi:MAG: PLP-dependent aminotransferase family protein [Candidatus Bruticola sp.]